MKTQNKQEYKMGKLILTITILLILTGSILIPALAADSNIQANVQVLIPVNITINSPVDNSLYSSKRILLDVSLSEQVADLEYSIDTNFRKLCRNCQFYSGIKNFQEGQNNLTIKAESYFGYLYYKEISFLIDSTPPFIIETFPTKTGNGSFYVVYTEPSPVTVFLHYGLNRKNLDSVVEFENCLSGENVKCYGFIDLSVYQNQNLYYQFEVKDPYTSSTSGVVRIKVDVTADSTSMNFFEAIIAFLRNLFG